MFKNTRVCGFCCDAKWLVAALSLFLLIVPPSARAEVASAGYHLSVAAERESAVYALGENVRFIVQVKQGSEVVKTGTLHYALADASNRSVAEQKAGDDVKASALKGELKLTGEPLVIEGKKEKPGFLFCWVEFQPPTGKAILRPAAVAVAPLEIKPSLPAPDDFDAFWSEQKKKLAAVPMDPEMTPVGKEAEIPAKYADTIECFDVQLACAGGLPASGYFARPKGAKPKSLPIILRLHSAGIKKSDAARAASFASKGMLAMDLNAHAIPNLKPGRHYKDINIAKLGENTLDGRESRETCYYLGMFLRMVRAIDFLTAQPEWDGRVVAAVGNSQGGGQALVIGGLDPRVTFVGAACPVFCDFTGKLVGRTCGCPNLIKWGKDGKPDPATLAAARYFDAMNFSARSKAETVIWIGFTDTLCPADGQYAAYNQLQGKKRAVNEPFGGHWFWPDSPPDTLEKTYADFTGAIMEQVKNGAKQPER